MDGGREKGKAEMTGRDDVHREFTRLKRSWYGAVCLKDADYIDQIVFGLYAIDGGTTGEALFRWYNIGGRTFASVELCSDVWFLLKEFNEVFEAISIVDSDSATPEEIERILSEHGFADATREKES